MTLVAARAHLPCRIFRGLPRGPRRRTPTPRCLSPQEVSQQEAVNHTEGLSSPSDLLLIFSSKAFSLVAGFPTPPGHDASTVDYRYACLTLRSRGSLRLPHRRDSTAASVPSRGRNVMEEISRQTSGEVTSVWCGHILRRRREVVTLVVGSNVYQILNELRDSRG